MGSGEVETTYGNRLRVRICGVLVENDKILLVKHRFEDGKILYAPPGGGQDYGESAETALKKEFKEETGLIINVEEMLFVHEYKEPPLHALEIFFSVRSLGGKLRKGRDPETKRQIIEDVSFYNNDELGRLPKSQRHHTLRNFTTIEKYLRTSGYLRSGR